MDLIVKNIKGRFDPHLGPRARIKVNAAVLGFHLYKSHKNLF